VIYYIPTGSSKLLRKEVYGNFTTPLTLAQLQSYCNGDGKLLSKSITSLIITPNTTNNSAQLTLAVQNKNLQGKIDQQSVSMTITMRN